jgi:cadmium resistance protein CadD (predicted permease)
MLELSLLGTVALLLGIALLLTADSDDDDSNGGILQPIPVRIQDQRR